MDSSALRSLIHPELDEPSPSVDQQPQNNPLPPATITQAVGGVQVRIRSSHMRRCLCLKNMSSPIHLGRPTAQASGSLCRGAHSHVAYSHVLSARWRHGDHGGERWLLRGGLDALVAMADAREGQGPLGGGTEDKAAIMLPLAPPPS